MRVNQLILKNFRNYNSLELDVSDNINIFIGQNAQGKTNILEAIYYGAMGRSHRTTNDAELLRWQQKIAAITILFTRLNIENKLTFHIAEQQKKEIILNGHTIKQREIVGLFNVVMFSPEDLLLIKGPPNGRRKFLDTEISQASPYYYKQLIEYNRILAQRNNLIKKIKDSKAKQELLDTWDEQLASQGEKVICKRQEALKKLTMLANLMHRRISANKENLTLKYYVSGLAEQASLPDNYRDWMLDKLQSNRQLDINRGSTSIGPHRDDLILNVNGVNLRIYGSQGQQRTGVLALKLAELEFIKSETSEYPVLLLDDVMSELDNVRREHLLMFIKDKIQTFITATEKIYFADKKAGSYHQIVNGKINQSV